MTLTPQQIVDSIMQGKHDTILQGFDLHKFVTQVFEIGYIVGCEYCVEQIDILDGNEYGWASVVREKYRATLGIKP